MIFPALLTVCEDAIHREWIGSSVYHHKICDAPINTQDVQTFIIASFCSALHVTSRPPRLCLPTLTFVTAGFASKINWHMHVFCYLDYYLRSLLGGKYAFKEARGKGIITSRGLGVNIRRSTEQPPTTWCRFDEHDVVPLFLPEPLSACWPRRVLFKSHKSHTLMCANNSTKWE